MAELSVVSSDDLSGTARGRIRTLLDDAFDGRFSDDDWEHSLGGVHVVVTHDGRPVSHVAVVPRELQVGRRVLRCGYVEAVATAAAARRRGHATWAMRTAEEVIRGGSDLGVLSTADHRFYEHLGWERWQGPSFVIRDGERVRTADEDDGIMVLRFGATAGLPLWDPIACRARSGDDW